MRNLGFNHIDLATKDMAATRAFYEGILGFPAVRADIIEFEAGARAEHVFFDCGGGQMIAFATSDRMRADLDTGINKGLGLPPGHRAELGAIALLCHPRWFMVLQNGWTEPFLVPRMVLERSTVRSCFLQRLAVGLG